MFDRTQVRTANPVITNRSGFGGGAPKHPCLTNPTRALMRPPLKSGEKTVLHPYILKYWSNAGITRQRPPASEWPLGVRFRTLFRTPIPILKWYRHPAQDSDIEHPDISNVGRVGGEKKLHWSIYLPWSRVLTNGNGIRSKLVIRTPRITNQVWLLELRPSIRVFACA